MIGTTVFVWTDCSNNERLPDARQDPAYLHEGVAMPQSALLQALGLDDATGAGRGSAAQCNCNEDGCDANSPPCCANGTCGK